MVLPFLLGGGRIAAGAASTLLRGAFARRAAQARFTARIQWFGGKVQKNIRTGMTRRINLAAQLTRDKVVLNIRRPVTKFKGRISKRVRVDPASRSKPGEFPKLDTGRLSKDVFWENRGPMKAVVGTTLDYGLVLETRLDRSFLRRTLREMRPAINRIISSGPPLPGQE